MYLTLKLKKNFDYSHQIEIGKSIFSHTREVIENEFNPDKCIIITDENVFKIYKQKIKKELTGNSKHFHIYVIPADEKSKSQKTRDFLENEITKLRLSRDSMLIAIGGGVVGDITGFLASTLLRGIKYINVPTTIIAQVDSSIGGKTAINTKYAKNLIGTFHYPSFVLIDTDFLQTLDMDEYLNGISEIIKTSLVGLENTFSFLEKNYKSVLEKNENVLLKLIKDCVSFKSKIIMIDPTEKNWRKILNFGHTVGHALESLSGYRIKHGFAIAEGMITESYMAFVTNGLSEVDLLRIQYLIDILNLDKKFRRKISFNKAYDKMLYDKKKIGNSLTFSLIKKIGLCSFNNKVNKHIIELAYRH